MHGGAGFALKAGQKVGAVLLQEIQPGPHVWMYGQHVLRRIEKQVLLEADDSAHTEYDAAGKARCSAQQARKTVVEGLQVACVVAV